MDGYGKGDEMSLVDRITGEKEEEESDTVMVAERWVYGWWVTGVWLEKLNIWMMPNMT